MHRTDLTNLPQTDQAHLSGDINRAYQQLAMRWLDYMEHLKRDYPYLFSLAVRTNPFDAQAVIEVRS
jgi:voltage-gated potassium channel